MTDKIYKPASLVRRLMALVYDVMLLAAILFCSAMLYTAVVVSLQGNPNTTATNTSTETGDVITELEPVALGPAFFPVQITIAAGFYLYFWHQTGQTLGMKAWKIQLVNRRSGKITIPQLLVRLIFANLSFILFGLGYIYLYLNKERLTVHDKLSVTRVIQLDS